MDIEAIEKRVKRLEDIEEIRKLKAEYCDFCDAGLDDPNNCEALLARFTEDARVDFGMGADSVFEGRAGLEAFFGQVVPSSVSFCMHMVHNSVIDVHGDRATGRWYFEAPTTNAISAKAQWMAGRYLEEYVRDGGSWKFASITVQWNYIAAYDQGWGDATGNPRTQASGG